MNTLLLLSLLIAAEPTSEPAPARPVFQLVPGTSGTDDRRAAAAPLNQPLVWNERALQVIRSKGTPPPVAARHLALVHAAIFDAANAIERSHEPFLVAVAVEENASGEAAQASAACAILSALYPDQATGFRSLRDSLLERFPDDDGRRAGVFLGQFIAEEILRRRADDGTDRDVGLTLPNRVGVWKPTPPDFKPPLLPHWGRVAFFAVSSPECLRPAPPPVLGSVEYRTALKEVRELGGRDSRTRTADQTEIAKFWADGAGTSSPPGHWNRIAQALARDRRLSSFETARLFALLNATLADAAVCCWECKYRHALWRPVDAIRESDDEELRDTAWLPLLPTPPFPSYTSGHSSFSGGAATVLASFFGSDRIAFESTSEGLPGVTRSFTSFSAAADEAGRSRIYGGIHFEFDNSVGLAVGRAVADQVMNCLMRPREPGSAMADASGR